MRWSLGTGGTLDASRYLEEYGVQSGMTVQGMLRALGGSSVTGVELRRAFQELELVSVNVEEWTGKRGCFVSTWNCTGATFCCDLFNSANHASAGDLHAWDTVVDGGQRKHQFSAVRPPLPPKPFPPEPAQPVLPAPPEGWIPAPLPEPIEVPFDEDQWRLRERCMWQVFEQEEERRVEEDMVSYEVLKTQELYLDSLLARLPDEAAPAALLGFMEIMTRKPRSDATNSADEAASRAFWKKWFNEAGPCQECAKSVGKDEGVRSSSFKQWLCWGCFVKHIDREKLARRPLPSEVIPTTKEMLAGAAVADAEEAEARAARSQDRRDEHAQQVEDALAAAKSEHARDHREDKEQFEARQRAILSADQRWDALCRQKKDWKYFPQRYAAWTRQCIEIHDAWEKYTRLQGVILARLAHSGEEAETSSRPPTPTPILQILLAQGDKAQRLAAYAALKELEQRPLDESTQLPESPGKASAQDLNDSLKVQFADGA